MIPMPDPRILVAVQDEPLDLELVDEFLRDERSGAVCIFTGTTRRWTGSAETLRLDYEAYDAMAEAVMRGLVEESVSRWRVSGVAVLHRTGQVPVAEASVIIGVSAPHRAHAFEACRWLIDTLKTEVPIWKKESYADGRSEWVGPPTNRTRQIPGDEPA